MLLRANQNGREGAAWKAAKKVAGGKCAEGGRYPREASPFRNTVRPGKGAGKNPHRAPIESPTPLRSLPGREGPPGCSLPGVAPAFAMASAFANYASARQVGGLTPGYPLSGPPGRRR